MSNLAIHVATFGFLRDITVGYTKKKTLQAMANNVISLHLHNSRE